MSITVISLTFVRTNSCTSLFLILRGGRRLLCWYDMILTIQYAAQDRGKVRPKQQTVSRTADLSSNGPHRNAS